MLPESWTRALAATADPERARRHLELLHDAIPDTALHELDPEAKRVLASALAGSRWISEILRQHPEWLGIVADPASLRHPRHHGSLQHEATAALRSARAAGVIRRALDDLHQIRLRELLRIAVRDLAGLAPLEEILGELSHAADVFLDGVLKVVWEEQTARFGTPWHLDPDRKWRRTAFAVLGMGKLGGVELNYSSDVDLLFVYTDEGGTYRSSPRSPKAPSQVLPNHQFFKRLCEAFIREASCRGVQGGGLRIDMRLRPEGDSGPLARSLDSYENFYAEWGQTWERMMLLKARGVAGDPTLAGEFLEIIHAFRYPRFLGEGLLKEMAEMKRRIEREVVRAGEVDRNIKLGRGGIREIEFVAQSLQVLHGGRNPFLQTHQTLVALRKLAGYGILSEERSAMLEEAYRFLRNVEHRLQMDEQRQTHTLPEQPAALERLARLMGFPDRAGFLEALHRHTARVRETYESVLGVAEEDEPGMLPPSFDDDHMKAWRDLLARCGFRDPDRGVRLLRLLVEGPGFGHVSRRTGELGRQLVERILELCPGAAAPADRGQAGTENGSSPAPPAHGPSFVLSDPDRVVARLDSYISNYGARASLYELWTARPNLFEHILKLFDRSEFLAELAIREPDLVDQLEIGGHITRQKDAAGTLADLRHGLADPDQHLWLRRYFQTEFMRLGLRDILDLVDFQAANAELGALATACVQYALEVVARRHRLRTPPFAVIGLGKFGGNELVYGSDLDVIFVAPDRTPDLARLQKLASETIDLLSSRTAQGSVFVLDTRLRPDGEKGLLVNLLRAHEDYYRGRAMLWEVQALTRARFIAGQEPTGAAFVDLARRLTNFRNPSLPLQAFQPDWKAQIAAMRLRIERERTPRGKDALAFKTGAGGLVDIEFLAQALAMEHGWFEPNTLRSLEHARDTGALPPDDAAILIENYNRLRRMESILRRWSFEGEAVLPDDPAAQLRVAVRCGYSDTARFLKDLALWRADVRAVYTRHMGA